MRKPLHQLGKDDIEASDSGHRWFDLVRGYIVDIRDMELTIDPSSVLANTTAEQTFTLTGIKSQDYIISVVKPTLTAGLGVLQGRASADDTLAIQFINTTIAAIDPPSEVYQVIYIKNTKA